MMKGLVLILAFICFPVFTSQPLSYSSLTCPQPFVTDATIPVLNSLVEGLPLPMKDAFNTCREAVLPGLTDNEFVGKLCTVFQEFHECVMNKTGGLEGFFNSPFLVSLRNIINKQFEMVWSMMTNIFGEGGPIGSLFQPDRQNPLFSSIGNMFNRMFRQNADSTI
ncbi:uncharacterized protein LOC106462711 [Limulus polyphemus]|uniref:Uncharacterized protein LOC106462711 n=1 Tax=Limulus polyphemus TaxID=6850 RepID=A0ABM1SQY1_LIMPO|nr:uncharacterized protein LOC106462711 [Limulus polyphemus]